MDSHAATRPVLFKQIIKYRLLDVILCSMCAALFIIPSLLFNLFISDTFLMDNYFLNVVLIYTIKIIFFVIFGIGISGAFYFFKKLVFSEGASVRRDYFEGIKKNWKKFSLIYFMLGLLYGLIHINSALLIEYNLDSNFVIIIMAVLYALYGLFIIVSIYMQTQTILYEATFLQLLKNGIKFTVGKIIINLGLLIICILPFGLMEFISNDIVYYICLAALGLGYLGLGVLIFTLYSHSIFDMTINKEYYPELIKRGLSEQ